MIGSLFDIVKEASNATPGAPARNAFAALHRRPDADRNKNRGKLRVHPAVLAWLVLNAVCARSRDRARAELGPGFYGTPNPLNALERSQVVDRQRFVPLSLPSNGRWP
jgi:hypothetical protein